MKFPMDSLFERKGKIFLIATRCYERGRSACRVVLKSATEYVCRPHSKSLGRHASTWWTAADPKKEKPRERKVAGPVPFCWTSLADYLGLSDFLWRPSGLTKSGRTKMSCPGISETYLRIGSKGGPGGSGKIVIDMLIGDTKNMYGL